MLLQGADTEQGQHTSSNRFTESSVASEGPAAQASSAAPRQAGSQKAPASASSHLHVEERSREPSAGMPDASGRGDDALQGPPRSVPGREAPPATGSGREVSAGASASGSGREAPVGPGKPCSRPQEALRDVMYCWMLAEAYLPHPLLHADMRCSLACCSGSGRLQAGM